MVLFFVDRMQYINARWRRQQQQLQLWEKRDEVLTN